MKKLPAFFIVFSLLTAVFFSCATDTIIDGTEKSKILNDSSSSENQENQDDQGGHNPEDPPTIVIEDPEDPPPVEIEDPEEPAVIEAAAELVELSVWHFTSGIMNNRIKMIYPDANAVFCCTVNEGRFNPWAAGSYVQEKNVYSGETIYWQASGADIEGAFVEIVLKKEENIIGYAVIEIYKRTGVTHEAVVLKSVLFPPVSGKYQDVSEEYVKAAIEEIKNGNNESVSTPITDAESLRLYLQSLPDNDSATPYAVSINVSDLSGIASALIYNKNKYVNLDLSGSTLTSIGNSAFRDCTSLIGITMPANVTSVRTPLLTSTLWYSLLL
jgi:hypothetical protein